MTHGVHDIFRHSQVTKHFPRDQRLRLETPGWRELDFEGNVMREQEVEHQREWILSAPQVVREREYPFSEYLIVDSANSVDVSLPVLAKVSALVEALPLDGRYKLVHQLWSHFTLIAGQLNVDVSWYRDEVLVSGFLLPYHTWSSRLFIVVLFLVNHSQWHVPPHFEQFVHLGKVAWLLLHRVCGAGRTHLVVHSCWDNSQIRRD